MVVGGIPFITHVGEQVLFYNCKFDHVTVPAILNLPSCYNAVE